MDLRFLKGCRQGSVVMHILLTAFTIHTFFHEWSILEINPTGSCLTVHTHIVGMVDAATAGLQLIAAF